MAKKRGRPKKLPALQVRELERQFRESPLPVFLTDRELRVIYANDYARTVLPEADRPEGLRELLPEGSLEGCLRQLEERESFRLALPPRGSVCASLAVTPIADGEDGQAAGAMVMVTCSDQPGEPTATGASVSAISNSMRRPLSNIFASLAVLRRRAIIMYQDGQSDGYLQSINDASYQLLRNVNNLVRYQKNCSGERGRPEVVDFWERLAPLLDACDILLHDHEIPFRYELPPKDGSPAAHVSCRFDEVEEALLNLISNAFLHTRPGNRVEVTGRNTSTGVVVTVSDCGRGIEADQLDRIFTPFYSRGEGGHSFAGMGMGLTVARQNILLNGGTIAVDSVPGKGTSIAFTLPTCDRPLTPPAMTMACSSAQYLQDHFSRLYIGLCDVASLPPQ